MSFGVKNYAIAGAGSLLLVLGFWVMYTESAPHGFGWRVLVAGPVLLLSGFVVQFLAIFYRDRSQRNR